MERCPWCVINELEIKYHDEEWGVPVRDDRKQFEHLSLEVMQCGLSWDTVLQRREVLRACFDGFDFERVAAYTETDVQRILDTPGMIRARRKIEAIINNARCFLRIREEFGSFSAYLWGWTSGKSLVYRGHAQGHIPPSNALSARIARDLKRRGLKFVGPVTVYAHMQSCGLINDHLETCHRFRQLIEQYDTETVDDE